MKIFGSMVMRNEASRYLDACLRHMRPFLDELFIWDDRSDDNSVEIAQNYTEHVYVRPMDKPSFLDHEAHYRYTAWQMFERVLKPQEGDWVLSFDADEFLVDVLSNNPRSSLIKAANCARTFNCVGVSIRFPEVFDIVEGIPQVRIDGLWDTIRGPRFFEYHTGGRWRNKAMGCGSEPAYVHTGKISQTDFGLTMLHYGYANTAEHQRKYERYSRLLDHGHNNAHIESIIGPKKLIPWHGPIPQVDIPQS